MDTKSKTKTDSLVPHRFRHWLLAMATVAATTTLAPSAIAQDLFDTWIGYDTGTFANGRYPWAVAHADLDGDSNLDLVLTSWQISAGFSVLFGDGQGRFGPPVRYGSPEAGVDIAIGDFDADGLPDVVHSNTGFYEGTTISVYRNLGGGVLDVPDTYPVGSGPAGLAVADFNGDASEDIAICLYKEFGQESSVALLFNAGDGTFGSPTTYPAGPSPYKIAAGDLNGDGVPDLAVANYGHRGTILSNLGNGTFGPPVALATGFNWSGDFYPTVVLADLDDDGDSDILHASTGTHTQDSGGYVLFRNNGLGGFGSAEFSPFGTGTPAAVSLSVADLNEDDHLDVVAALFDNTAGGGFCVAFGDGTGSTSAGTIYPSGQLPCAVLAAPLDGDGTIDVVCVANSSLEVTIHPNPGDGVFLFPPLFPIEFDVSNLHLDTADLDDDGDFDIAFSYYKEPGPGGEVGVLWNDGLGNFSAPDVLGAPNEAFAVKCRDLDGDGLEDLLWFDDFTYDGKWRRNLGEGLFASGVSTINLPNNCGAGDIDAFDLDHDGDLDVVATEDRACAPRSARYIDIAPNLGEGNFGAAYTVDVVESISREVTGGDFNQDGNLDLAIGNFGLFGARRKVIVLLGIGNGLFHPPSFYTVGEGPEGIVTADLDGDGFLDIATNNTGQNGFGQETISILYGHGDGTFANASTHPGSYSPDLLGSTGIVAGDADSDGDLDLLVSNYASNDIAFHENLGGRAFAPQIRYGIHTGALDLVYEDFTGDGIGDVAATVTHLGIGSVAVLPGLVSSTTSSPVSDLELSRRWSVGPNPFRDHATFRLRTKDLVVGRIFDVSGRSVVDLSEGRVIGDETVLSWNGRDSDGRPVIPGVYFVRFAWGGQEQVGKVLVRR